MIKHCSMRLAGSPAATVNNNRRNNFNLSTLISAQFEERAGLTKLVPAEPATAQYKRFTPLGGEEGLRASFKEPTWDRSNGHLMSDSSILRAHA